MNKSQRKYHELLLEALDQPLGLNVRTNDAQKLQRELGVFRVWARKNGITTFDALCFRSYRPSDSDEEFLHITKKLGPDEIKEVQQLLTEENQDAEEES